MLRKPIIRLLPCRHFVHSSCYETNNLINNQVQQCHYCREAITSHEQIVRKVYKKHSVEDRKRVVRSANRGEDWVALSMQLNVPYKTAYQWVRSGEETSLPKGGKKPKSLMEEQIDAIIGWVEEDCGITLKQLQSRILNNFHIHVSVSTIGNYLEGRVFTMKQIHNEPVTMNSIENKALRAQYVVALNEFIQQGKQIVWLDETNFNLFCRRKRGRAKAGNRAVQKLPSSKGPNVHLICAISAAGVVHIERRRGSFTAATANAWVQTILTRWEETGNQLEDLVIVPDNAPCHKSLETVIDATQAAHTQG